MDLIVILFNDYEALDVFGPVEVLARVKDITNIKFVSLNGGPIVSSQQVPVLTSELAFNDGQEFIFLIPGGRGTRSEVNNEELVKAIKALSSKAKFTLSVCTGSALLAKTGLIDGKEATTNKRAFDWVIQQGLNVKWIKKARWVKDGNTYTSSGVSAGIDMALGFIADVYGLEMAEQIATGIEYIWNKDREDDIFSSLY